MSARGETSARTPCAFRFCRRYSWRLRSSPEVIQRAAHHAQAPLALAALAGALRAAAPRVVVGASAGRPTRSAFAGERATTRRRLPRRRRPPLTSRRRSRRDHLWSSQRLPSPLPQSIRRAINRTSSLRAPSAQEPASWPARTTSSARTGGDARARSSSSTATSARGASCSTTSFSVGTTAPSRAQTAIRPYLCPMPLDNSYTQTNGNAGQSVTHCGPAAVPNQACSDKTETSANLRLRLDPEIHISDNLRIITQIDLLDNLVLGSTPDSYAMKPAGAANSTSGAGATTSRTATSRRATTRTRRSGFFSTTQGPPTAGVNGCTNSINVKRVWGEYMTPVGQLRFGRMPGHWGLGMVENSGDGIDSDYQTTLDRIMFVTGIKSDGPVLRRRVGLRVDRARRAPTPFDVYGGQPYNTCNLCNVNEWAAFVAHRTNPELQRLDARARRPRLNGGLYAVVPVAVPRRRRNRRRPRKTIGLLERGEHQRPRGAPGLGAHPGPLGSGPLAQVPLRGRGRDHLRARSATCSRRQPGRRPTRSTSASTGSPPRPSTAPSRTSSTCSSASAGRAATPGRQLARPLRHGRSAAKSMQNGQRSDLDVPVPPRLPGRPHLLPATS